MTLREYFVERRKAELPVFMKVLRALPKDQLAYKPQERSPSAEQLVWTLTKELAVCLTVIDENKGEWTTSPPPPLDEMVSTFERSSNELIERASQMDDEAWSRKAEFFFKGKKVQEQPVGEFLWWILFDAIHHRGQLAAYLRPMGGKVPPIYGPSADERPQPS
jgi:uncharacterized damage-inducible protein DinB